MQRGSLRWVSFINWRKGVPYKQVHAWWLIASFAACSQAIMDGDKWVPVEGDVYGTTHLWIFFQWNMLMIAATIDWGMHKPWELSGSIIYPFFSWREPGNSMNDIHIHYFFSRILVGPNLRLAINTPLEHTPSNKPLPTGFFSRDSFHSWKAWEPIGVISWFFWKKGFSIKSLNTSHKCLWF